MVLRIPPDVARKIGYYVYLYVDPRNGRAIYVGKGKGSRVLSHLKVRGRKRKAMILRKLKRLGRKPRLDILCHGLADEETAFLVEASVIDSLGLEQLTNEVRGKHSKLGRLPLRDLVAFYRAKPVVITDPVILIRINRLYRPGMAENALYEVTRGVWRVNTNRASKAKYALAVFEGVVREVYAIDSWHAAGSTRYSTRTQVSVPGRSEFTGKKAPATVRKRYLDKSVRRYFRQGLQFPLVYQNC